MTVESKDWTLRSMTSLDTNLHQKEIRLGWFVVLVRLSSIEVCMVIYIT